METKKLIGITAAATAAGVLLIIAILLGPCLKPVLKMAYVARILEHEYYFDADMESLTDYALSGMAISTEDPYTNYYPEDYFSDYMENHENSYLGVGIVVGADERAEHLEIMSVTPDSPAERAGLLAGDLILSVDGTEYSADDMDELVKKLRGEREDIGTMFEFLILRNQQDKILLDVEMNVVEKDTVRGKMLEEGIGYLRITGFDRKDSHDEEAKDTYDELLQEEEKLRDKGMKKLILDLRDNPGGDLEVVSDIADYFLPRGIITYTETKQGKRRDIESDAYCVNFPMVVLINGNSASASEVLTAALKDYERAAIVGETSFGKGIVQTIFMLPDHSGMSVTTAQYFSPKGNQIHKIGIEPDVVVASGTDLPVSQIPESEDVQLQKAIELIRTKE